jgi:hypothetical protein
MKTSNFLFGVLIGAFATHIYYRRYSNKKLQLNPKVIAVQEEIANVQQTIEDESSKFSSALKEKYDIVLIPNKYSKRAKAKGKQFTDGRYSIDPTSIKEPLSL